MMTIEKLTSSLFYVDLNNDKIEWINYDPEAKPEDAFAKTVFTRDNLMQAFESTENKADIFDVLEKNCDQKLIFRSDVEFMSEWKHVALDEPFAYDCTEDTAQDLVDVFLAKEYINAYCRREFRSNADFDNLSAVPIGYTTITDAEHDLQAYANLNELRVEVYVNDKLAKFYQYDTLWEMANLGLPELEFDDLIDIPDWIITKFEREDKISDLAVRLCFFMKETDPFAYAEIMTVVGTDAGMVRKVKDDLHDMQLVPDTLSDMQELIRGGSLSNIEVEKCYELMTEIYHLYADVKLEPIEHRQAEILFDALYAMNLNDYKVGHDDSGLNVSWGDFKWVGGDIYRHFAEGIPAKRWRELRDEDFRTFTDFKDIAARHGVQLSLRDTPNHERRVSR